MGTQIHTQLDRQQAKTRERVATLAALGIKASVADLNGVRIGAADTDRIIAALRRDASTGPRQGKE